MHIFRTPVLFLIFCIVGSAQAQHWTEGDYELGFLKLAAPFDSLEIHLGKPDHVSVDDVFPNYIESHYFHLVVWHYKSDNRVCAFDIQDSSFATFRGLRIGDSLSKMEKLYGHTMAVSDDFRTCGPYNLYSDNYTRVYYYSAGDFHIAFFTKDQIVVEMVFYLELHLTDDDWQIGFLKLDASFDSIFVHLGKPDSTSPGDYGSTGFYYPKLVLWRDDAKNTLCAMDIYDSSLVTSRGLKIGDSLDKIEALYGSRDNVGTEIRRLGPYDYAFNDYTEVTVYGYGPYFFTLCTKGQTLVKMLLYVGVNE